MKIKFYSFILVPRFHCSEPRLGNDRALEGLSKQEREALMTIIDLATHKQHLKDFIRQLLEKNKQKSILITQNDLKF